MKVKITKLNNLRIYETGYISLTAVHFKLDEEDYYLHYSCAEYEDILTLYKGRNKGHVERVNSCYGNLDGFVKFIKKPGCLRYVDTENFIEKLKEKHLL